MPALAAAQTDRGAEHYFFADPDTQPEAEAVAHLREVDVAGARCHLAGVVENQRTERPPQPAIVLSLEQQQVRCAEAVIAKAAEGRLAIDVRPAECLLQVK